MPAPKTKSELRRLAALLVGVALSGCNNTRPSTAGADSSSSASRPRSSAPKVPTTRPTVRRPKRPACRIVKATGKSRIVGGGPLKAGLALRGTQFLELEKDAQVVVRHAVSTREVQLFGPSRAMPCVNGDEHVLLSRGELRSVAGPGARPGAQVVVAHPWGTASYGNALIKVTVTDKSAKVVAVSGEAWLTTTAKSKLRGPAHLTNAKQQSVASGPASAKELVRACEATATASMEKAKAVLKSPGPDSGPLGERAAIHLKARQAARAACFSAGAAAGLEPDPAEFRRLAGSLKIANSRWKSVPKAGP